ncbi:Uncharacterised protein [Weissella viridescens]|uniref:Uncharacterized protein n=1 Tax=Weissella viridescens TaxID=1629 RepID=A0A380P2V9_WEIVI|nr:Uncharacterised protein [Weissella viridescens]
MVTLLLQYWLYHKTAQQIKQLLIVSVFASLTVLLAYEANIALKQAWGRVRPYELNTTQSDLLRGIKSMDRMGIYHFLRVTQWQRHL